MRIERRARNLFATRWATAVGAPCLIFSVALCEPAKADDVATPASGATQLEEVIVTASKREEKLRDVPADVSAVTGASLEKLDAQNLDDYAQNVPGVTLVPQGRSGATTITFRGVQTLSVGSTTGTYIDDAPFGSANNFASGGELTPDLDPSDLERVEFLKGPQGTLYGGSSLGGLIKYVTKAPDLNTFSGRVSADVSDIDHGGISYTARAAANIPLIDDELGLRTSTFFRRNGGFIDDVGVYGENANDGDEYGLRSSLLFKPNDKLSVRVNALLQNAKDNGTATVDVDRATLTPLYGDLKQDRLAEETNELRLQDYAATINYDFGPATATSITSYSQIRSRPWQDYTGTDGPDLGLTATQFDSFLAGMSTNKTTEELRLASNKGGNLDWLVGGFFQHEADSTDQREMVFDGATKEPLTDFGSTPVPGIGVVYLSILKSTLTEYAAFGDLTYHFTPTLEATVGARGSNNSQVINGERGGIYGNPADPSTFQLRYNTSRETVGTYLADVKWTLTDNVMAYVRAASGYRPGGPRSFPPGLPIPADFKLTFGSDTVWNYEIGTRTNWLEHRLTFDATAYDIEWSKIQALQQIGSFFVFSNAGNARVNGFEFESTLQPIPDLTFSANATYTHSELLEDNADFGAVKGESLPYTAKWSGGLGVDYTKPLGDRWSLTSGALYHATSSRFTDFSQASDRYTLKGYGELDLRVGLIMKNTTLNLYAKNALDKRAYTSLALDSPPQQLEMNVNQPRTIGVGIAQTF